MGRFFWYTFAVYSVGVFIGSIPFPWGIIPGFIGGLFMAFKEDDIKSWLGIKEEKDNGSKV